MRTFAASSEAARTDVARQTKVKQHMEGRPEGTRITSRLQTMGQRRQDELGRLVPGLAHVLVRVVVAVAIVLLCLIFFFRTALCAAKRQSMSTNPDAVARDRGSCSLSPWTRSSSKHVSSARAVDETANAARKSCEWTQRSQSWPAWRRNGSSLEMAFAGVETGSNVSLAANNKGANASWAALTRCNLRCFSCSPG